MKVQLEVFKKILKKNIKWFIIEYSILLINGIINNLVKLSVETQKRYFLELINYIPINRISSTNLYINLFQIIFCIYISRSFITYELDNSFENIVLREKEKKWLISKIIIIVVFTIVHRLSLLLLIYIFNLNIKLSLVYINTYLVKYISIAIVTILITTSIKNKYITLFLLTMNIIFLNLNSIYINSIIIIVSLIYNLITFKFHNLKE